MDQDYDVAVVGGGVVGCAIARELTRYRLRVVVLERESDVARGTSGKNSGVVHTGFNVPSGTLKARLNVAGARMFEDICSELGVPFKRVGKLVVAPTPNEVPDLERLKAVGDANGVPSLEILDAPVIKRMEPNIAGYAALHVPTAAIICPYSFTIALAEAAVAGGAEIMLETEVKRISGNEGSFRIRTSKGTVRSKLVVNSAGLYSDTVARLAGVRGYKIYPNRGEYLIIDKAKGDLINRMIYPVPPKGGSGLGVHLTPTVDGNILVGPTATYIRNKRGDATTASAARTLFKEAKELLPSLDSRDVITTYAGIRAKTVSSAVGGFGDFIIEESPQLPGMMHLVGIESPGLTAAPAIAVELAKWVGERLPLHPNPGYISKWESPVRFRELELEDQAQLVDQDADYGKILCRCEVVTRKEVLDALQNPLGVLTLVGIKLRSRAMMGRCQGGFCSPRVVDMVVKEMGTPLSEVSLRGAGSWMFTGAAKGSSKNEN